MKRMYLRWVLLLGFGFVYQISILNAQIVRDDLTIKFIKSFIMGKQSKYLNLRLLMTMAIKAVMPKSLKESKYQVKNHQ